ncbi:hypothetical protein VNO78_08890 [Psophocarpus tetragonolobus]|uniref:Uncharacterized protein n=1 Tax=Psophocarpus tetragonolobus TaxID=3891 RepID=A0AAN9SVP5_PSOTE
MPVCCTPLDISDKDKTDLPKMLLHLYHFLQQPLIVHLTPSLCRFFTTFIVAFVTFIGCLHHSYLAVIRYNLLLQALRNIYSVLQNTAISE